MSATANRISKQQRKCGKPNATNKPPQPERPSTAASSATKTATEPAECAHMTPKPTLETPGAEPRFRQHSTPGNLHETWANRRHRRLWRHATSARRLNYSRLLQRATKTRKKTSMISKKAPPGPDANTSSTRSENSSDDQADQRATTVTIQREATLRPPWTVPPLSSNSRGHWSKKHRASQTARQMIYLLANAAGLPKLIDHADVTVHYRPANGRYVRDESNLFYDFKPVFDALAQKGVRGASWPLVADDREPHMRQDAWRLDREHSEAAIEAADEAFIQVVYERWCASDGTDHDLIRETIRAERARAEGGAK
jgi:hypothetical protein